MVTQDEKGDEGTAGGERGQQRGEQDERGESRRKGDSKKGEGRAEGSQYLLETCRCHKRIPVLSPKVQSYEALP